MIKIEYDVSCPQIVQDCKYKEILDEVWWFLHSSKKVITIKVDNPHKVINSIVNGSSRYKNLRCGFSGNELVVMKK